MSGSGLSFVCCLVLLRFTFPPHQCEGTVSLLAFLIPSLRLCHLFPIAFLCVLFVYLFIYIRNLLCTFSFHFLVLIKYLSRFVLHKPVSSCVEGYRGRSLHRKELQNQSVHTKPSQYKSLPDIDGYVWSDLCVLFYWYLLYRILLLLNPLSS